MSVVTRHGRARRALPTFLTSSRAYVVAVWAVWSSVALSIKVGLGYDHVGIFSVYRVLACLLVLLPLVLLGRIERRSLHSWAVHRWGLLLGLFNVTGFMLFQGMGLALAPVGIGVAIVFAQPLVVALLSVVFLGERLYGHQVVGILLGWAGVAVVGLSGVRAELTSLAGVALLLLCCLSWAVGTVIMKLAGAAASARTLLFLQCSYGIAPILLFVSFGQEWVLPHPVGAALAAWAGVGGVVVGFGLQLLLLRRHPASLVSSWFFPIPVFAAALGVFVLGESLSLAMIAGAVLVSVSILLVNHPGAARCAAALGLNSLKGPVK